MKTKISCFKITHHALLRIWERSVFEDTLLAVIPHVICTNCKKDIIIISASFLKKKGIKCKKNIYLVIVAKKNIIKTCFWSIDPEYLYSTEMFAHFQILK